MLSRELARRVVFELNLTENAKFLAPTPTFSLWNLVSRATGWKPSADLQDLTAEQREAMAVARIQNGLNVDLIRDTSILGVSYSHPDPAIAATVANQVTKSFIDQTVDQTTQTSKLARQFIEEQVRETKKKLEDSEQALADYARKAGITVTDKDGSLISDNIAELNTALSQALQDRLAAQRYYQQVQQGNAATLPEVFQSQTIQDTKQKLVELKASYQENLATLKPEFPEMRSLKLQINEMQGQIDAEVASIATSIKIKYDQANEKVDALKRELADLEKQQADYQDKNIQYTILKRDVDSNRAQYDSLVSKLNEVAVGSDLKTTNASVIDKAIVPSSPYSPRLSLNVALATALFASLAAALIYLLELMKNDFSVPDQIESELKLPVLGILPATSDEDMESALDDNKSALSEAFRSLRTSLQFTATEGTLKSLLVTSAAQGEGKSTSCYKLARDFAALGQSVLVIDADLRKPRMHRMFNTDNALGLTNLLSNVIGRGEVRSTFHKTNHPGITLLPAGTIPPNPVELLMSQRMAQLIHWSTQRYDLVIIDSPPVMGLADACVLSRLADATLLIVSARQVTRKAVKGALGRLKASSGNVVGAALSKFAVDKFDYNYAYRYMHYNYYGYEDATPELENHTSSGTSEPILNRYFCRNVSGMLDRLRRRFA